MRNRVLAAVAAAVAALTLTLGAAPAFAAANDQQIADQGVIVAGDLSGTWTASPNDPADEKKALKLAAATKGCTDYAKFAKANLATTHAASDDYTSANGAQISNHAYVHADAASAAAALESLRSTTVPDCLSALFTKALDAELAKNPNFGRRVRNVELTLTPVNAPLGSYPTVAYKGTAKINLKNGASQSINVALFAVQVDRVILAYSVQATPSAVNDLNGALNSAPGTTATRTANALSGAL